MVVDKDGNVLSTEMGEILSSPEPTIYTEVVYVEAEPVVVDDSDSVVVTVTVEAPETETETQTVTVVEGEMVE